MPGCCVNIFNQTLTESQPQRRLNTLNKECELSNDLQFAFCDASGYDDVQIDGHAHTRLELVSCRIEDQTLIISHE